MQLHDTHLVLLSAAAQRNDRLLVRPDKLRGRAADLLASRLEAAGLIETIAVGAQDPHWRTAEDGAPVGLRLLMAGFAAIGVEVEQAEPDGAMAETQQPDVAQTHLPTRPRGTKRTVVLALLQREEGASIADIIDATGWLAHSTRAALTGLRKAGHPLARAKDAAGRTVYRLTAGGEDTIVALSAAGAPTSRGE